VRLIRKFLALNYADRCLLVEAWLHLGAARLALLSLPFRRLSRYLGTQIPAEEAPPHAQAVLPEARRIAWAVDTMSRHTPWESACLAQAVAGKLMLRRRSVPAWLYLGTRKDEAGSLVAHAWLQIGEEIVLGGAGRQGFTALSAFGERAN
jgi:hypothetical protein